MQITQLINYAQGTEDITEIEQLVDKFIKGYTKTMMETQAYFKPSDTVMIESVGYKTALICALDELKNKYIKELEKLR